MFPLENSIKLECYDQQEVVRVAGTYLFDVPKNCQIDSSVETIRNEEFIISENQVVLFPRIESIEALPTKPLRSVALEDVNLDELHTIKTEFMENEPVLYHSQAVPYVPSIWTILIYALLIFVASYWTANKIRQRRTPVIQVVQPNGNQPPGPLDLQEVRLPM